MDSGAPPPEVSGETYSKVPLFPESSSSGFSDISGVYYPEHLHTLSELMFAPGGR